MIIDLIGFPAPDELENITGLYPKQILSKIPQNEGKNFQEIFPGKPPLAIDLLRAML